MTDLAECADSKAVAVPEAIVTPVNTDAVSHMSSNCVAAVSDSTLPDEPTSSLLLAIVSSDEPSTRSTITTESSDALPVYNADITESSPVISSPASAPSFITSSSSYAGITQSFLPSGSMQADAIDVVQTADCLLRSVPDEEEEEMVADEQIEDWDQEVFDP